MKSRTYGRSACRLDPHRPAGAGAGGSAEPAHARHGAAKAAPGGVRLTPAGGRTVTRAACPAPGRATEARRPLDDLGKARIARPGDGRVEDWRASCRVRRRVRRVRSGPRLHQASPEAAWRQHYPSGHPFARCTAGACEVTRVPAIRSVEPANTSAIRSAATPHNGKEFQPSRRLRTAGNGSRAPWRPRR